MPRLRLGRHLLFQLGDDLLARVLQLEVALAKGGADHRLLSFELVLEFRRRPLLREGLPRAEIQKLRIVAGIGLHLAVVLQQEDATDDAVEESRHVRDHQHGLWHGREITTEPGHGLFINMVGGLVEQKELGLLEEQTARGRAGSFGRRRAW